MLESAVLQYAHIGPPSPRDGFSCVIARGSFLVREVEPLELSLHRSNKKQLEYFVARFVYSAMVNLRLIHLRS